MTPRTRILHHGRRPRPAHIPKLKRRDVADLLALLLIIESTETDDTGQAEYLDSLRDRAGRLAGWEG